MKEFIMAKKSFLEKLWNAFRDYWEAIGIFIGVILGVYDVLSNATNWGLIKSNWVLPTGVALFFVFGVIAIIKSFRKARNAQEKIDELEKSYTEKLSEIARIKAESSNQSGGQNIAAEIVNFYGDNGKKSDENPLKNYDEISGLMNTAIDDTSWFTNGFQLAGEPEFDEKQKIAFQSGKNFHAYFGGHRHYFSETARELLEKLDQLIFTSIRTVWIAKNSGNAILWSDTSLKFQEQSKILREKIINEFQKGLVR